MSALGAVSAQTEKDPYYTEPPILLPAPSSTGKPWNVRNFGPVGIGIDLVRPGMTMKIVNVEEGSPADKTGKLEKGQIIESINGVVLKDRDPREILGDIITRAEAKDGKINLKIKDLGNVLVEIPVMGSYSDTWPVNCPKSDKIVRGLADYLAGQEDPGWGGVLFMLSTGEEKDLDVVRKWMDGIESIGDMNWQKGYKGPGLCEYYLRTGDQSVLPVIKKMTEELKANMYRGSWSGRGGPARFSYGPLHASGVHCATFLIMARMCGVDVDDHMFDAALTQFYRYAGHGNVAYGDGMPEGGFRDNGKTSGLAVMMAAAALLTPEGESSVYARARDNSAMKAFYATNWFHAAHTGGGMGEIWHHKAMHIMREKRPVQFRSYFDTRRWVMELSRRHDGTIGIAGMTDRYDQSASEKGIDWGTFFALTYTLPRKQLQLHGAPRSKWAKHFQLPERPWGTPADDVFHSMEPSPNPVLSMEDLLTETVENDASLPVNFEHLNGPGYSRENLVKYLHHPEFGLREIAMRALVAQGEDRLVVPLLKSHDPRLRHAGIIAITGMFKGRSLPGAKLTPEMFELIGQMIHDPDESWWVVQEAARALGRADRDVIVKHKDRLIELTESESQWIRQAAVSTLSSIALDPEHCQEVLPKVVSATANADEGWAFPVGIFSDLDRRIKKASPKVKEYAEPVLREVFGEIPSVYQYPGGTVLRDGAKAHRKLLAQVLGHIPGNMPFITERPKKTVAYMKSGDEHDLYTYDGKFERNDEALGIWYVISQGGRDGIRTVEAAEEEIENWIENWEESGSKPLEKYHRFEIAPEGKFKARGWPTKQYADHFWSGDRLIGIYDDQALKFHLLEKDRIRFMVVPTRLEVDDPTDSGEEAGEWKPGYWIFVKESGDLKIESSK